MASVSAGHIILTPTQPVESGRPQRESNPGTTHKESRALPTELPRLLSWQGDGLGEPNVKELLYSIFGGLMKG